ncbi:methylosome protein 50-like [Oppia nitens]|uniref:methylosome protein 50-like n=1 Tax=Oppia nitens TaxID=1686743 RepID=UPI0023DC3439|nr:methylosome protein 50-like [Oppia nitens]
MCVHNKRYAYYSECVLYCVLRSLIIVGTCLCCYRCLLFGQSFLYTRRHTIVLNMSSLHHLPRDEVSSKIPIGGDTAVNNSNQNAVPVVDENDTDINGKAYGKYFEAFHIFNDNSVVIASDNLSGFHQTGYVTKYDKISDVPKMPVLSLNPDFGGICNLIALRDRRLVAGFDSGHISLLGQELEEELSVVHHDNPITRLNVNRLESKIVSSGHDMTIIILDIETFVLTKCYNFGHSATVWDIDFSPCDDNLVLSCSRDKNVLLWDLNKAKPSSRIATLTSDPTALCWSSKDISMVFIGTENGHIKQFDVRMPGKEVADCTVGQNRVYRIKRVFNGNGLAVCCNDNVLRVLKSDSLISVYENSGHTDWVRDVSHYNKQLYSVGRDSRLDAHIDCSFDGISITTTSTTHT